MAPDVRHCKKTGPVRTAPAVPCRHASSRQADICIVRAPRPRKAPHFRHHRQASACARQTRPARPGQLQTTEPRERACAESTPRARETHQDSVVTPRFVIHAARPGNEDGGSARRRHFPHASAQPRIRLAPSIPLLPCPQKNSCGTNVFGTSFPLNAHENPQQNLPDALTENRYFTRTKVY